MAEKEEDQVDLELAAIRARIKRKLSPDEIDNLLDEFKDLARAVINRKRRKQEIAAVSVQPTTSTAPTAVTVAPPPPLQRQPMVQTQEQAQDFQNSLEPTIALKWLCPHLNLKIANFEVYCSLSCVSFFVNNYSSELKQVQNCLEPTIAVIVKGTK